MNPCKEKNTMNQGERYQQYYTRYYFLLRNIYTSRFKWTLPEEIPPRFLEEILLDYGEAIFFKDDIAELYGVAKINEAGRMDNYNHGDIRFAYANNYVGEYTKENSVLIYDSYSQYPYNDIIIMHAEALATMRLTRDLNLVALRTPYICAGNRNTKLTVSNLFKQLANFIPWITVNDKFDMSSLKVLNLDVPYNASNIQALMKQEISDFLTEIGIANNGDTKKERMIMGEVESNNGITEINLKSALELRKRSCKQIRKVFKLTEEDVDVEPLSEIDVSGVYQQFGVTDSEDGEKNE